MNKKKKKPISDLSTEEAMDQLTFRGIDRKIELARRAKWIADQRLKQVFDELDSLCIDPGEIPTAAENATTLEEAIACYVQYGEYSRSGLLKEIKAAYGKEIAS